MGSGPADLGSNPGETTSNYALGFWSYKVKDGDLLSTLAAEIGQLLQCFFFFFLNLPQHFDFIFFDEQSLLHPEQAALRASSVIETLEAIMFGFSIPQNGQTIQVSCRTFPHSEQLSMPCIHPCSLGSPKKI